MKNIYRLQTSQGPKYYVHEKDAPETSFWIEDHVDSLFAALNGQEVLVDIVDDPDDIDLSHPLLPVEPSKIVCIGLNYAHHAKEMNKTVPEEPLMFLKPSTTARQAGQKIELPPQSQMVHHEAELALVIGKKAKDISDDDDPMSYLLGYTCANDVTARDIQRKEKRYTRGKGFDTFCPLGPFMVSVSEYEPKEHRVQCRVNGELKQDGGMDDLIFSIETILRFVSSVMTLLPGDVILTGTPMGVGEIKDGDVVEVHITGLGTLQNPVCTK